VGKYQIVELAFRIRQNNSFGCVVFSPGYKNPSDLNFPTNRLAMRAPRQREDRRIMVGTHQVQIQCRATLQQGAGSNIF
jgi:hypothetical protein